MLRDLIIRYAKWQEAGGVRHSTVISNRRGSTASNDENDHDVDNETDIIAWDFDTSPSDATSVSTTEERETSSFISSDYRGVPLSTDTLSSRSTMAPPQLTSTIPSSTALEHPLEQLFNDDTIRSATAPPGLRPRKDTLPSRPVSPIPPLLGTAGQSSSMDSDYRPGTALEMTAYDLRLPEIPTSGPIQIEIPATEALRKDAAGVRSRSATITRSTRSDSAGSAGFSGRNPRYNPPEPMPQPHSPPTSSRAASPKPQPPSFSVQGSIATSLSKAQPSPTPPPKLSIMQTLGPPGSPPKGHISSKSVPNNSSLSIGVSSGVTFPQDLGYVKQRPSEIKAPRSPNLTLNVLQLMETANG